MACRILVLEACGVEPAPPAVESRRLNHWTAREVLSGRFGSILLIVRLSSVEEEGRSVTYLRSEENT